MKKIIASLITSLIFTLDTHAGAILYEDIKELSAVKRAIEQHVKSDPGNVLVVFDIDDTLLASRRFFGGDTWYNWQLGREVSHEDGSKVVITERNKISCIFAKLGTLYELGLYNATEPKAAEIIARLQEQYDVIALTSRSPDYRAGTERELQRAGFDMARDHLLVEDTAFAYRFDDGRSKRPVTFQNGIVMSTGLNKGKVLTDLLKRTNREYNAIFFIDDSRTNIVNMHEAWKDSETHVAIFHYTRADKTVNDEKLQQALASQRTFDEFLKTAFPERHASFRSGECN
mgnify:FL=1